MRKASDGLIQIVSDNFDAQIHSQNGLKETHNLGTIITQPQRKPSLSRNPIPRLKQEKLKYVKITEVEILQETKKSNNARIFLQTPSTSTKSFMSSETKSSEKPMGRFIIHKEISFNRSLS